MTYAAATLRNRAEGMARITLVQPLSKWGLSPEQMAILHLYDIVEDLVGRLSDVEVQLAAVSRPDAPVFASRRRAGAVDFTSRRRMA